MDSNKLIIFPRIVTVNNEFYLNVEICGTNYEHKLPASELMEAYIYAAAYCVQLVKNFDYKHTRIIFDNYEAYQLIDGIFPTEKYYEYQLILETLYKLVSSYAAEYPLIDGYGERTQFFNYVGFDIDCIFYEGFESRNASRNVKLKPYGRYQFSEKDYKELNRKIESKSTTKSV